MSTTGQLTFPDPVETPQRDSEGLLGRPQRESLDQAFHGLLREAATYARGWIERRQGSANEFVQAMEAQFGALIRMHLKDVVGLLREESGPRYLRDYLNTALADDELEIALGAEEEPRNKELAALDEMFRRSRRLQDSDHLREVIRFVSRLKRYSAFNNALVYSQNPDVSYFATAVHWRKEFGRWVNEDARPMVILAPMTPVLFVYDLTDTDGPELPQWFGEIFETRGVFDSRVMDHTLANCVRLGISVRQKELGLLHGGSARRAPDHSPVKMAIDVKGSLDAGSQYAILVHEIAHVLLGHLGSDHDRWWPARLSLTRDQCELEAEAVTYIVCRRAELVTRSDEYLAGYLRDPKDLTRISLDLVMKTASRIEEMGQRLLPPRKSKTTQAAR